MKSTIFCFKAVLMLSLLLGGWGVRAQTTESSHMKKVEAEMNLSTDQLKKITAIKDKYAAQMKEQSSAVCESRVAFQESFKSSQKGPEFQKVLQEKFTKYSQAKAAQKLIGFKMAMEIREILNTEQIIKFNEIHNPARAGGQQCAAGSNL